MLIPDIPDSFCSDQPQQTRRLFWTQHIEEQVTSLAKALDGASLPTESMPKFSRAWILLARDRPDRPAHKCSLRRKLIKRFYHKIQDYVECDITSDLE